MEGHAQWDLFSPFSSWCWHFPLTLPVVLVSSLVAIDSFKGSKCMFETVFDLSAGGIIMQKTLLRLSWRGGEGERFKLHTWKTVTFRLCLDPWLPPLHNQSSYNENATNHHWIPSLLSGPPSPHPFPPHWKNGSDISAWEWRIEAVCNVCSIAFSFFPCSST